MSEEESQQIVAAFKDVEKQAGVAKAFVDALSATLDVHAEKIDVHDLYVKSERRIQETTEAFKDADVGNQEETISLAKTLFVAYSIRVDRSKDGDPALALSRLNTDTSMQTVLTSAIKTNLEAQSVAIAEPAFISVEFDVVQSSNSDEAGEKETVTTSYAIHREEDGEKEPATTGYGVHPAQPVPLLLTGLLLISANKFN